MDTAHWQAAKLLVGAELSIASPPSSFSVTAVEPHGLWIRRQTGEQGRIGRRRFDEALGLTIPVDRLTAEDLRRFDAHAAPYVVAILQELHRRGVL